MTIRTLRRALALAVFALPLLAAAQAWPARPVRMVAVFPPGGSVDQVARVLSQQLSTQLGQQFVVDNKGGASGSIGTGEVARSAPDGYTFAVVFDTHAVNPALIPGLSFNTTKDLASVTLIGTSPMAIVAHTGQPYRDFRDVIAAAKTKPGSVAYGSIGSGSLGHLAMAQLGNQLGIEFTHVPYRGGGPLMNDAVAGQVPLAIGTVFLVSPHVKAGKVKALAVTSAKADASLPGARRSSSRARRASRRWPGGACSRQPARRNRSCDACTTRSPRRSRCRPWPNGSTVRAWTSSEPGRRNSTASCSAEIERWGKVVSRQQDQGRRLSRAVTRRRRAV